MASRERFNAAVRSISTDDALLHRNREVGEHEDELEGHGSIAWYLKHITNVLTPEDSHVSTRSCQHMLLQWLFVQVAPARAMFVFDRSCRRSPSSASGSATTFRPAPAVQ
eukprot:6468389-Amphidinium_carterae.2